jgi:hypothetical protein
LCLPVEEKFLKKMIDRCLTDYFGELSLSPFADEDYELLIEEIMSELRLQQDEAAYVIVHDKVYSYLAAQT